MCRVTVDTDMMCRAVVDTGVMCRVDVDTMWVQMYPGV